MTFDAYISRVRSIAERRLREAVRVEVGDTMAEAEGIAKGRVSGSVLKVRSGYLRRSIAGMVDHGNDAVVTGRLRAGGGEREVRYARIHELGGVVTPNGNSGGGGQWLAIPTAFAPGGRTKHTARDVPGLTFRRTRRPDLAMLVNTANTGKRGRGKQGDVVFWLVKSVTIPARPYLRPSFEEATADLHQRINAAINRVAGAA